MTRKTPYTKDMPPDAARQSLAVLLETLDVMYPVIKEGQPLLLQTLSGHEGMAFRRAMRDTEALMNNRWGTRGLVQAHECAARLTPALVRGIANAGPALQRVRTQGYHSPYAAWQHVFAVFLKTHAQIDSPVIRAWVFPSS